MLRITGSRKLALCVALRMMVLGCPFGTIPGDSYRTGTYRN